MHGARVLTDHPTLAWPAARGAKQYRVELLPGSEGEGRPLWRVVTSETRLSYPEEEKVLERGGKYRWRVLVLGEAGKEEVAAEGKFFTALDREVERLAKVRFLAEGTDPVGWLIAADSYDASGVYGKALPLYEKLAAHSPGATNYQLALAAYYTRAGREADAKKALERAKKPVKDDTHK
jgi:tetratricopeptide (TPR) repeat protein